MKTKMLRIDLTAVNHPDSLSSAAKFERYRNSSPTSSSNLTTQVAAKQTVNRPFRSITRKQSALQVQWQFQYWLLLRERIVV
jgi:hypothetical protein